MKIVFAGGGSGGHFYPIVAVAEELERIIDNEGLLKAKLFYIAPHPFDKRLLFENDIEFIPAPSGKMRVGYGSFLNFLDSFKIAAGIVKSVFVLFRIYPDVIFSKGGYASVPILVAARILRIPVFIHDSDAVPGRTTLWAAKFAARIAISYPEAADKFTEKQREKIAFTGNPVRRGVATPATEGVFEYLELARDVPTIFVIGGSQGALHINDVILEALPILLEKYQVIHQTGEHNFAEASGAASIALENNPYRNRYKPFPYLSDLALRMAAGAATLIVSRAGSGSIFEIAAWGKPSIMIPIPEEISRDQRENAFAFARAGAAVVIEEVNLSPHVLAAEIDRLVDNPTACAQMAAAAVAFRKPDAAEVIAREIMRIALKHEVE